jgi:hypothetical protein
MRLCYFDSKGDTLALPIDTDKVRFVRVDLETESPVSYAQSYERASLQFAVRPKNLRP